MPGYRYVHMGREGAAPVTLLVYTEPPYDIVSVDRGPHVRVRRAPAAPAEHDDWWSAPAYRARNARIRENTLSGG